jgi:hypothetical protein
VQLDPPLGGNERKLADIYPRIAIMPMVHNAEAARRLLSLAAAARRSRFIAWSLSI